MHHRIHQRIRTANIWILTSIIIVVSVTLTTMMNLVFAQIGWGGRVAPLILVLGMVDAALVPAILAPIFLNLFKRAANLQDLNQQLAQEIDERKRAEQAAERRAANLAMVSEMAIACAAASPDTYLPKLIAEKLHSITGAFAVGLSTYEAQDRVLTTRCLSVSGKILDAANKILGRSILGLASPVSPEALNLMLTDGFIIADSLTETTFGAIPRPISAALQTTFGIGSFVGLGLCYGGELWGAAVIALRAGQSPLERDIALTLANIAAVALRRQKAEEALRREKQFSDDILQGLPGVFFMYDDQARLVRWNRQHEQMLGYSAQELAGMRATDFFEEQDRELITRQMRKVFTEGEADAEATVVTRIGQRIPYYFVGLRTLLDSKPYLIGFGIDITDRKQVELERQSLIGELEAKNKELEQFTYTVSHDLRSPLITIRGFLSLVEKDVASGNTQRVKTDIARIMEATDKMQRLLEELLELSRIGRLMNPPQFVPFETVVREAIDLVRGRITARGVQIEIAEDLPTVYGDRTRLVQVVQNLVDNAVKFMDSQPQPRIEIGQSGTDAQAGGKPILFVRDNGMGIDRQYQDKVFGLFNKLDAQSEGTGVGLALVRRIIEVHGGRIWVESAGNGKGATFYFTLPTQPSFRGGQAW